MTPMNNHHKKILVWDLPTRVFHWLFAIAFLAAWLMSDDDRYLYAHSYAGYVMTALLIFRIVWGFCGGVYSRFNDFIFSPRQAFQYLRSLKTGKASRYVGHNPAGSWSIYLLLFLTATLCLSGLIVLGGEEGQGPLAESIDISVGVLFHDIHMYIAWIMLALVGFHICGVVIESYLHRENLVGAMLDGSKNGGAKNGDEGSSKSFTPLGLAILLVIVVSAPVYFKGYLQASLGIETDKPYTPYVVASLPTNDVWLEECGDCHAAYHPSLLPARSWVSLLQGQNDHFGDELDLDDDTINVLMHFATNNAAEKTETEAAWKINKSTPADSIPLRITETVYWVSKHEEISELTWKNKEVKSKGNCSACHMDADKSTFQDSAMRLPE